MGILRGRDFLTVNDFTRQELGEILDFAAELKTQSKIRKEHRLLRGKTLGMIFLKSSTRTRVSFEVGMAQLGGHALYLNANDLQVGRGEPVKDTARVLARYLDGIVIRTFAHAEAAELAEYADIPVINGLTDLLHPCQAMADLLTVRERTGRLDGLKLAYVGDGNNVAHSLLLACSKVGMDITVASPAGYEPRAEIVAAARENAKESNSRVEVTQDVRAAAAGAHILYTDVWTSMGQDTEREKRLSVFASYRIDAELLKLASPAAMVMHCLPAHRGEEITDEVMESAQSVVFDQAENRLHAQKAILAKLL